jgi:hypothetical protein
VLALLLLLTHRKLLQSKVIAIENDLRGSLRPSNSGSLAMLAAIRRALTV